MDYEKSYKNALERARSYYNNEEARVGMTPIELEEIFPELAESEDERMSRELIAYFRNNSVSIKWSGLDVKKVIKWLEKQSEQPSAIRWYDVSLMPQETEELLVEWGIGDATWHEIAFYNADFKTFWNCTRQVENVRRWCYITDLLEKQGERKPIKASYTTIVETGNGGVNTCVTRELSNGEKKSAWSDDDEQYLLVCKNALAKYQTTDKWDASIISCWLDDKLKSIRPQNTWKP